MEGRESSSLTGEIYERVTESPNNVKYFIFKNGYSHMSNAHYSPFKDGPERYRSVEQFVNAKKALNFKEYFAHQEIMREKAARNMKNITVTGYDYAIWNSKLSGVIKEGLFKKFQACADAREKLMSTGSSTIVYASLYDRVLGNGIAFESEKNTNPADWEGMNLLGKLLMEVRDTLNQR